MPDLYDKKVNLAITPQEEEKKKEEESYSALDFLKEFSGVFKELAG
jgi:hypothetical protein